MNIFRKYILKSNLEKKGRMFLILISITITTALLVASIGAVNSVITMLVNQAKGSFESFNTVLYPGSNSKDELIDKSSLKDSSIKNSFSCLKIGGYFTNNSDYTFNILGTDYSDFRKFSSIKILNKDASSTFEGQKIIISKAAADKLKVKAGDVLSLTILGKNYNYNIWEIASNNGIFQQDSEESSNFTFVTPYDNAASIIECEKGKYNFIYISVDSNNVKSWIKSFNSINSSIKAKLLVDESELASNTNDIKVPLIFMLSIVLLMSMFIIYSSFKLTITERIPVIGTFLSQGSSFYNIIKLFIRESLLYGLIGGLLGNILGFGIIVLITNITNPLKAYGIPATVDLKPSYFILGMAFAIILSLISALIPILSIRKMQIKDVILNTVNVSNRNSWTSFVIGIVFIIISIIFHITGPYVKNPRAYITALPSFFISFIGIILLIPKLTQMILYPLVKLFKKINGTWMISINNLRTSKILLNNIRLITVSILAIILIMSLKSSVLDLIQGIYKDNAYDVHISVNSAYDDPSNLKLVNSIISSYENAKEVNAYSTISSFLNGDSSKEIDLKCIDPMKYKDLDFYTCFDNKEKQLDELSKNDDGIIISTKTAARYHIKTGDTITLNYENMSERFKVISSANVKYTNLGNTNFISLSAALKHFGIKYADTFKLASNISPQDTEKELKSKLKGLGTTILTRDEDIKSEDKNSNQIVSILGIFSYITMIIGAFGILSNVSISFIQRKRELAVLSSVGLTNSGRGVMIFIESILQAFIGILVSILSSFWIISIMEDLFKYLLLGTDFKYPFSSFALISAAAFLLMLLTSLPSMRKSKNLQIVNELKYE